MTDDEKEDLGLLILMLKTKEYLRVNEDEVFKLLEEKQKWPCARDYSGCKDQKCVDAGLHE